MDKPTCAVDECERPVRAMKLCGKHYAYRRRTSPNRPRCSIQGCETATQARGLCSRHHGQWYLGTLVVVADLVFPQMPGEICVVEGCDKTRKAAGMCSMHLTRMYRTGDVGEAAHRHAPTLGSVCAEPGCLLLARRRQMCRRHYRYSKIGEGNGFASGPWALTVEQLIERDGNTCWLCGSVVVLSVRRPDPMCPSVDHVIALSRGGLDLPENVALAHLICNMRKGPRPA